MLHGVVTPRDCGAVRSHGASLEEALEGRPRGVYVVQTGGRTFKWLHRGDGGVSATLPSALTSSAALPARALASGARGLLHVAAGGQTLSFPLTAVSATSQLTTFTLK